MKLRKMIAAIALMVSCLFAAPTITHANYPCPGSQIPINTSSYAAGWMNVYNLGGGSYAIEVGATGALNIKYVHVAFTIAGPINYSMNQHHWGPVYYSGRGAISGTSYACVF